jgi:hypothetical protein
VTPKIGDGFFARWGRRLSHFAKRRRITIVCANGIGLQKNQELIEFKDRKVRLVEPDAFPATNSEYSRNPQAVAARGRLGVIRQ